MPIRYLPDLALSRDVPQSPTNRVKCLIYNTGVARRDRGTATLGHVRLPAAIPAEARAAVPTREPADRPKPRPASLTAMTTTGLSAGTPMTATTAGRPRGTRPRTSSASLRMSSGSVPSGTRCATRASPLMSSALAAISPADSSSRAAAQPLQLALGIPEPGNHGRDSLRQLVARRLELLAELADQRALPGQEAERVHAHQRLDPAHARADGRLAEHLDEAELAGPGHVRAAAQLARVVADLDHPDLVAVLLPEQGQRAQLARLLLEV